MNAGIKSSTGKRAIKIMLAYACLFAAGISPLHAEEPDAFGAGIIAGNPPGVTAKLWYGSRAVDSGVIFGKDLTLYGDYLWNIYKVLPQSSGGKVPVYLGVGFQVSPNEFGLRIVTGFAYWFPHSPVEMFLDVVPVLRMSPGSSGGLGVSAGVRYYFKGV